LLERKQHQLSGQRCLHAFQLIDEVWFEYNLKNLMGFIKVPTAGCGLPLVGIAFGSWNEFGGKTAELFIGNQSRKGTTVAGGFGQFFGGKSKIGGTQRKVKRQKKETFNF
jgi:hypothetical protein